MTSIHTKKFRVEEAGPTAESSFRTARRILFNPDVLKNAKISTGDVVVILNSASLEQIKVSRPLPPRKLAFNRTALCRILQLASRGLPYVSLRIVGANYVHFEEVSHISCTKAFRLIHPSC